MVELVQITEQNGLAVAAVMARRGVSASQVGAALGGDLPTRPGWTRVGPLTVTGVGPGAWLVAQPQPAAGWIDGLRASLDGLASVSDQSGAYRHFRIEGPAARTLLQRGAPIDLADPVFPVGSAAVTVIAHIDVVLRRLEGEDAFEAAVFRSMGESFGRWMDATVKGL